MTEHPFKHMRASLLGIQFLCNTLLGIEGLTFPKEEYAMYLGLTQITNEMKNPTRQRMLAMILGWMKFYWRLVRMLPDEHELKRKSEAELMKISEPYRKLLGGDWMEK